MATPTPEPSPGATAKSAGKRSAIPQPSPATAATTAQPIAALQQRAAGKTAANAEPDGNLGAPDSGAETASPANPRSDAATSARTPPGSAERRSSLAGDAARGTAAPD